MIPIVVAVFVMVLVAIFSHVVAIPVVAVAISVPIAGASVSSAAIIRVVVIPIVPYDALIVAEPRIIAKTRFVLPTPLPVFPLALTAQPVVLDIVVPAFRQPLPVVRIVISVVASGAVIWIISIPMLRASGGHDCSQSQS
jgi:hypothetical protein